MSKYCVAVALLHPGIRRNPWQGQESVMHVRRSAERNGHVATPTLTRLAWALGAVAVALVAATLVLIVRMRGVQLPPGFQPPSALSSLQFLGPAIAGAVLAGLRPRNPMGWLLLGLGRLSRAG